MAASIYGMETEVIEGVTAELRSYAARLEAGDESLLQDEQQDAAGTFVGEEFRAILQRALAEGEVDRLKNLPWGIGAGFAQGPGVPSSGKPGIFFGCRTRGDHRYWRFLEAETGQILANEAEMLRRIDSGSAPATSPPVPGFDLEGAWAAAVESIVEEHSVRADPRREEERIGPVQRFAIDLLLDPSVILPAGAAEAEEALSAGRSSAVRQALGEVRTLVLDGTISRNEAAEQIVKVVQDFGLQPVEPPPPLERISQDDVGVVCWMAVLRSI